MARNPKKRVEENPITKVAQYKYRIRKQTTTKKQTGK